MTDDLLPYWGFEAMPAGHRLPTKEECLEAAGRACVAAIARRDSLSPRQAALEAYEAGGPSVDELEAEIHAQRGLPPDPPRSHRHVSANRLSRGGAAGLGS